MQVVNQTVQCAVQDVQEYLHINRGPGDRMIFSHYQWSIHYGRVAQLHKNNLKTI